MIINLSSRKCEIKSLHHQSNAFLFFLSFELFVWCHQTKNDLLSFKCNYDCFVTVQLWSCQELSCQTLLPTAPRGTPDLAVSFHSASLPSFTQISSNSVNSSWATCSASSSVPRMNWTRWDGVSEARGCERGKRGEMWFPKDYKYTQHYSLCHYMATEAMQDIQTRWKTNTHKWT